MDEEARAIKFVQKLKVKDDALVKMQAQLEAKETINEKLRRDLESKSKQVNDLCHQNCEQIGEKDGLKVENNQLYEDMKEARMREADIKAKYDILQMQYTELENKDAQKEKHSKQMEKHLQMLIGEKDKLIANLCKKDDDCQRLIEKEAAMIDAQMKRDEEITMWKNKLAHCTKHLDMVIEDRDKFTERLAEERKESMALKKELQEAQEMRANQKKYIESLEKSIVEESAKVDKIIKEKTVLEKKTDELEKRVNSAFGRLEISYRSCDDDVNVSPK